jgi:hypothetical protein
MSTDFKDGLSRVNAAVSELVSKDRAKAVEILGKFGATCTPELKREDYQSVHDLVNAELARIA